MVFKSNPTHTDSSISKAFHSYMSYAVMRVHDTLCHSGDDNTEATPVPIPNTVVKLSRAEDTWLETARKNKCRRILFLLSSAVEHSAVNRRVAGSNPAGGAIKGRQNGYNPGSSFFVP